MSRGTCRQRMAELEKLVPQIEQAITEPVTDGGSVPGYGWAEHAGRLEALLTFVLEQVDRDAHERVRAFVRARAEESHRRCDALLAECRAARSTEAP